MVFCKYLFTLQGKKHIAHIKKSTHTFIPKEKIKSGTLKHARQPYIAPKTDAISFLKKATL